MEFLLSDFMINAGRLKEEKKFTFKKLYRLTGISSSQIASYFHGYMKPNENHIRRIANCLDTTPEELLGINKTAKRKEELINQLEMLLEEKDFKFNDQIVATILEKEI